MWKLSTPKEKCDLLLKATFNLMKILIIMLWMLCSQDRRVLVISHVKQVLFISYFYSLYFFFLFRVNKKKNKLCERLTVVSMHLPFIYRASTPQTTKHFFFTDVFTAWMFSIPIRLFASSRYHGSPMVLLQYHGIFVNVGFIHFYSLIVCPALSYVLGRRDTLWAI